MSLQRSNDVHYDIASAHIDAKDKGEEHARYVTPLTRGVRAFSVVDHSTRSDPRQKVTGVKPPTRRLSTDPYGWTPKEYDIDVDETLRLLRELEDTDKDVQITIEDTGPKSIMLGTALSSGFRKIDVRTNYHVSNLLQELTLAKENGETRVFLRSESIFENPVDRLSRLVKHVFWKNLTRRIDGSNVETVGKDPKDWTSDPRPRIYVPHGAPEQYEYYTRIAKEHPHMRLDVQWLSVNPENEDYVRDLNDAPGLLALAMERVKDTPEGHPDYRGLPFVVPGGRFNELYGWDSYMESQGLVLNGRVDLAKSMVKHFCFCIKHYGKILNANRTYYLCRTQPPFLTDMALLVYREIAHKDPDAKDFLREAILAAIKEYHNVWMSAPRYDAESGLSRYRAQGRGVPPETEASHFDHILKPFIEKHNMKDRHEFVQAYNQGAVLDAELDEYFLHDRAVRESGHDTSYRLEKVAADLAVVDLNSCLHKYECDIACVIDEHFDGALHVPLEFCTKDQKEPYTEHAATWKERASARRQRMNKLMWNEEKGMYFDYNCKSKHQTGYESVTTFWTMWAGVCTNEQAALMVKKALPRFEVAGGLVSGTEESRGPVGLHRPNRQWDYPFGWAPQQILAWHGLLRYGYKDEAQRVAYRWLYMVLKAFYDYNGVVVEKYNVTDHQHPHKVAAEYGNQGSDFKGVAKEGFGWVNASWVVGLNIIGPMKGTLGAVVDWDNRHEAEKKAEAAKNGHGAHNKL